MKGLMTFLYDNAESAEIAKRTLDKIFKEYGIGLYPVQIAYFENDGVATPYKNILLNRKGIEAAFMEHEKGRL